MLHEPVPICSHKDIINGAVAQHRITVVIGATGSGKSTFVPMWLVDSAQNNVKVLCAQPRRVAAMSLAHRVSHLLGETEIGHSVGYRIRGDSRETETSRIVYATTGFLRTLLACSTDYLDTVTHVVLDEVHERTLDSDFLSLMVKLLLSREQFAHIKLVVMSATINASLFVEYFKPISPDIALVEIPTRSPFEINTMYLEDLLMDAAVGPLAASAMRDLETKDPFTDVSESALDLMAQLCVTWASDGCTTLVFLPGESAIAALEQRLVNNIPAEALVALEDPPPLESRYFKIHILHSLVPAQDQRNALKGPAGKFGRHIVLATNIAESSLTVDCVNLVIDSGLKKESIYDPVRKIHTLRSVWTSRASLMQRRGRTGRVCDGTVVRLLTRDFEERDLSDYDVPESLLSNPSRLFLSAKFLSERWRYISPEEVVRGLISVDDQAIERLQQTITELHATGVLSESSANAQLTLFGSLATWLQLDPSVSKLVYWGLLFRIPVEGVVLAAAASIDKDPFKFAPKLYPGYEERFAQRSFASMRHRIVYDMGFCSDLIMIRNLLVSWIGNRALHSGISEKCVYTAPFYSSGLHLPEFEIFRSNCALIARNLVDWLHMISGEAVGRRQSKQKSADHVLSRDEIDAIFNDLESLPPPMPDSKSNRLISETVWKCETFSEFLNFRKRCSLTRSDMTKVFLGLTKFEEADILKFIITLSLADSGTRTLVANSGFARCQGDVLSIERASAATDVGKIVSLLSGGIPPASVRNADKGVALVTTGVHADEETSLAIPASSEYSSVTTSAVIRHIMSVFEKAWKIDIWCQNTTLKAPKPYIYNICRWALPDNTRVYLCPRNPSAWLETRSRVVPSVSQRDNDSRRRTLGSTYVAIPARLATSASGQQQLRAEWTTVLPIRCGGRVGISMLLAVLPGDLRERFIFNDEGSETIRLSHGKGVTINPSFPFWEELVESIETVKQAIDESIRRLDPVNLESLSSRVFEAVSTMLDLANSDEIDLGEDGSNTEPDEPEVTNAVFAINKARLRGLEREIAFHFKLGGMQPVVCDVAALVSDVWELYGLDH